MKIVIEILKYLFAISLIIIFSIMAIYIFPKEFMITCNNIFIWSAHNNLKKDSYNFKKNFELAQLYLEQVENYRSFPSRTYFLRPDMYNTNDLRIMEEMNNKAIVFLEKAKSLNPNDCKTLTKLGDAYIDISEKDKSLNNYKTALKHCSSKDKLYFKIGEILAENNDPECISYLKKNLALKPDNTYAYQALGNYYDHNAEYKLSLELYQGAMEHFPGEIYFSAEIDTRKMLVDALDLKSNNVRDYCILGRYLKENEHYKLALKYLNIARKMDPEDEYTIKSINEIKEKLESLRVEELKGRKNE